MVRLVMILLGVDYLRTRWKALMLAGWLSVALGVEVFIDMIDGSLYFPIKPFAFLLLLEGLSTLAVAWTGMGGQRKLRYVKGSAFTLAATLILIGTLHGNFILSMIFGTLFLRRRCPADHFRQNSALPALASRDRGRRIRDDGGIHLLPALSRAVRGDDSILRVARPAVRRLEHDSARHARAADGAQPRGGGFRADACRCARNGIGQFKRNGMGRPAIGRRTRPHHSRVDAGRHRQGRGAATLIVDRYIAAVDRNGAISTGHAALESPEGIYISLYPGAEIDRSPDEFGRILRATRENDVPGVFQPDYRTESNAWCESTVKVRIRNYDPERLQRFWDAYRQDTTYNLTYRNCSSTVARALEAAIEGASARVWAKSGGWRPLVRVMSTPELWVAAQVRKRAATMAWTPGLTLDYARALSMLADPRPLGWVKMARLALKTMYRSRRRWQPAEAEQASASDLGETSAQGATRTEA